jgi:hypothetical protein
MEIQLREPENKECFSLLYTLTPILMTFFFFLGWMIFKKKNTSVKKQNIVIDLKDQEEFFHE